MTWPGAFGHLYDLRPFTLIKWTAGGHDQTTGARISPSKSTTTIMGALNTGPHDQRQRDADGTLSEGDARFVTELSYGVEPNDIIQSPDGQYHRIVQQVSQPHLFYQRFPTMDAVEFVTVKTPSPT